MMATPAPDCETLMTFVLPVVLDCCVCCALPLKSTIGRSAAAGDAGVRVGLHDAGNGCGDIEISFLRRLDDFGQFARTERTPPVDRRYSRFRRGRLARAIVIGTTEY